LGHGIDVIKMGSLWVYEICSGFCNLQWRSQKNIFTEVKVSYCIGRQVFGRERVRGILHFGGFWGNHVSPVAFYKIYLLAIIVQQMEV